MRFIRKNLSADGLLHAIRNCFLQERLPECARSSISWQDCLMSGLALFGLKFSSLLQFNDHKASGKIKHNLRCLYKIATIPSDTCLRQRLDVLLPSHLRRAFKKVLALVQRGKS